MAASDRQIFDLIVSSVGYRTTVGPQDKNKVNKAIAGEPSLKPSARLAQAAWELARRVSPPTPPPPPPPPPPAYKKVAPRVAYKQGSSDARYCTREQPGVVQEPGAPAGHTVDESGATYDENGLCKNGKRSDAPAVTGALEINSRDYCDLPRMGDPTLNTGSWAI